MADTRKNITRCDPAPSLVEERAACPLALTEEGRQDASLPEGELALALPADAGWRRDLRLLLVLAAPNVATMLAESTLNMVDFWIASRLGSAAQAAVLSAILVFMSIFGLLLGTMACVSTMVGQSFGAQRPRDCSAYAWQGIWLSILFGVACLALWPVMPALYRLIGHAPDVQVLEVSYTRVRLLVLGVAGANVALAEYFNGIQRPRVNTVSVIGANVINALLGFGLTFGLCGLPRLGFVGIAVGTLIATLVRAAWLLVALCMGRSQRQFHSRETWRPEAAKMRRLIGVGWPAGVQFVLEITSWTAFLAWIIGKYGTTHLAASNTCARITELSFMPALGIGYTICAMVGQSVGEGRPAIARRRARIGVCINMAYMGSMAVVFVLFGRPLIGFFSHEEAVIALGASVLALAAVYQMFDAVAISYSLALRGAGDTLFPAVAGAVLSWGIMVGGGLFMAERYPYLGIRAPWSFAAAYVIVIGLVLWMRWRLGQWQRLDVIARTATAVTAQARTMDPLVGREAIAETLALEDPPVGSSSPSP
jgi:MATE family multidrug resistance protein